MMKKWSEYRLSYLMILLDGALDEKMRSKIKRKIGYHKEKLEC